MAFHHHTVSDDPSEQEDLALLGAMMTAEHQGAEVSYVTNWGKWVEQWVKVEKAKLKRGRR